MLSSLLTKEIRGIFAILILFAGIGTIVGSGGSDNGNAGINPADFVTGVNNPFFTLTPGTTFVYEGDDAGETERIVVEVTGQRKTVLGVACTVVRDRVYVDDELVEDTLDWYAQDKQGNVWYFGEDVKNYEDGQLVNRDGSWEGGIDGAEPGYIMRADPKVGDTYQQEYYAGHAEDMAEVLNLNASVDIDYGSFDNCLQTKEWTPLEPGIVEHKFYCREIGFVIYEKKVQGESGEVALIDKY